MRRLVGRFVGRSVGLLVCRSNCPKKAGSYSSMLHYRSTCFVPIPFIPPFTKAITPTHLPNQLTLHTHTHIHININQLILTKKKIISEARSKYYFDQLLPALPWWSLGRRHIVVCSSMPRQWGTLDKKSFAFFELHLLFVKRPGDA